MNLLEQLKEELKTAKIKVTSLKEKVMEPLLESGFSEEEANDLAERSVHDWRGFKERLKQLTIAVSPYRNIGCREECVYKNGVLVFPDIQTGRKLHFERFKGRTFKDVRDYLKIANLKIVLAQDIINQIDFNN